MDLIDSQRVAVCQRRCHTVEIAIMIASASSAMLYSDARNALEVTMRFAAIFALLSAIGSSNFNFASGAESNPIRPISAPVVTVICRSISSGALPFKLLRFDVTLRNPSSEARWLLLPHTFPFIGDTKPSPENSESELQSFILSKHPRVLLVHALWGNFQGVLLPGRGWVTLRNLPIEAWWNTIPVKTDLYAIVARSVTIGGATLEDLIGVAVKSESGASVLAQSDAGDNRSIPSWHPQNEGFVPIVIDTESKSITLVSIPKR